MQAGMARTSVMLLGKLATSVSPKTYLTLLNATVKLMHQVMLLEAMKAQLTSPENPQKGEADGDYHGQCYT